MTVVEDVRKAFQDQVLPDLKSTVAKLDAAFSLVEERLKAQDVIAKARHNELLARIETSTTIQTARYDAIMRALDIDKRLEKIEARQSA